jgi:hypothetical protein
MTVTRKWHVASGLLFVFGALTYTFWSENNRLGGNGRNQLVEPRAPVLQKDKIEMPPFTAPNVNKETFQENSSSAQPNTTKTANQMGAGIDDAYVGVPFPVSASVEAGCNGKIHDLPSCRRVFERLKIMAQEPRDRAWATRMEGKIQDAILSEGPGIFGVRNVECRQTICAVEVISPLSPPYGAYLTPSGDFQAANHVYSDVLGYSPTEFDESGATVTVTLVVFRRDGKL